MVLLGFFCFFLCLFECRSENGEFDIRHPIEIEKVPFFAVYKDKKKDVGCGASIVTDQLLVTAAYCVFIFGLLKKDPEIVVGKDKLKNGQHYEIAKTYVHPGYDVKPKFDVAVIKLNKRLTFNEKMQPIKLADPGMIIDDHAKFQAVGFIMIKPDTVKPKYDVLVSLNASYFNYEKCADLYKKKDTNIAKDVFCARDEENGICMGDTGGPLVYNNTLVGINIPPYFCEDKMPVLFTLVPAVRDFLDKVIKENS